MELLHKAALYAVLSFVIVGAAISLAGPERVATTKDDGTKVTTSQNETDIARSQDEPTNGS